MKLLLSKKPSIDKSLNYECNMLLNIAANISSDYGRFLAYRQCLSIAYQYIKCV
jgi:hypothetical protein